MSRANLTAHSNLVLLYFLQQQILNKQAPKRVKMIDSKASQHMFLPSKRTSKLIVIHLRALIVHSEDIDDLY